MARLAGFLLGAATMYGLNHYSPWLALLGAGAAVAAIELIRRSRR